MYFDGGFAVPVHNSAFVAPYFSDAYPISLHLTTSGPRRQRSTAAILRVVDAAIADRKAGKTRPALGESGAFGSGRTDGAGRGQS